MTNSLRKDVARREDRTRDRPSAYQVVRASDRASVPGLSRECHLNDM